MGERAGRAGHLPRADLDSPTGPFADVKEPSVGPKGGDYDIFVDRDGTGWMAKTEDLGIAIWQPSDDYTSLLAPR